MRILVLADIHSNWPALAAIQEPFDVCLFVGDLVDYGTDPVPCIDWVRRNASVSVRGNHDHAVAQRIPVKRAHGLHRLAAATRPLHWELLNPLHMKYLTRLPVTRRVRIDKKRFYLVHATPRDPFDEYLREDKAAWEARLQGIDADFVLVGHTHFPFCMQLDRMTVLNPGSVGQPRDGDPRCAYAMIEDGRVEMRRVKYDVDATVRQMRDCGLDADTLCLAEAVLKSGGKLNLADLDRWGSRTTPKTEDLLEQAEAPVMCDDITRTPELDAVARGGNDTTIEFDLPKSLDDLDEADATTQMMKLPPAEDQSSAQTGEEPSSSADDDTIVLQLPPLDAEPAKTAPSKHKSQRKSGDSSRKR